MVKGKRQTNNNLIKSEGSEEQVQQINFSKIKQKGKIKI